MNKRGGNRQGGAAGRVSGRVTERQGRKANARPLQARAIASAIAQITAALFEATWATSLLANPTGAQVVAGGVTVSSPSASQMNITQSTPNAIVNWNTFSIGAGEAVNIAQPSVSSALLNRVVGNNPSDIAGRLSANGRVFLVNPAGVIFAPGSSVNVGSLVASTLNISDADFLAGRYHFIGSSPAAVRNAGTLTAQDGGTIALLGGTVSNTGTVAAKLGTVALGAGSDITLDFAGDGLTTLKINAGTAGALIGNAGTLAADGGTVVMSAQTADALAGTVINQQGIVRAQSLAARDGHIVLDGGSSGQTYVSGTLDASGGAGLAGGQIDVTGHNVGLLAGANLNASGATGGGSARVGGGAAGADPTIRNADAVWMDPNAQIHADATTNGSGGHIVAYGVTAARLYGEFSARGGPQGGDGGSIETSSHALDLTGARVDASALKGVGGTWKIDPYEVDIVTDGGMLEVAMGGGPVTFGPFGNLPVTTIAVSQITGELNLGTSVTITTVPGSALYGPGNINVQTPIQKTGGAGATLSLIASGGISIGYDITSISGPLGLVLDANVGNTSSTSSVQIQGATIDTHGGAFTIGNTGSSKVDIENSTLATEGGAVSIAGTNSFGDGVTIGYSTINSAAGNMTISGTSLYDGNGITLNQSSVWSTNGAIQLSGIGDAAFIGSSSTYSGVSISGVGPGSTPAIDVTGSGAVTLTGTMRNGLGTGVELTNASIAANGGAVALTSTDSASTASTGIQLNTSSIGNTGGVVTLTGNGSSSGIALSYSLIANGTGATTLNGTATGPGTGVLLSQSGVHAAGGAIAVNGVSNAAGQGANFGVQVQGDYVTSQGGTSGGAAFSDTGSGAISISGTSSNAVGFAYGVSINSATLNGAGGIQTSGTATAWLGFGFTMSGSTLSTSGGNGAIGIAGTTTGNYEYGVDIGQSTLTTAGGAVTLTGIANANSYGSGVVLSNTLVSTGAGNVQVAGTVNDAPGQTYTSGYGISAYGSSIQTTSGNVTLSGTTTGATGSSYGTSLGGGYTANGSTTVQPTIQTGSGAIAINGSVPATSFGSIGVDLTGASIASTSGSITLTGLTTGTPTTGLSSTGVVLGAASPDSSSVGLVSLSTTPPPTTLTTGSGTLSIRGSGSGANSQGVFVADGAQIVSTNGGAIDIRGVVTSPTSSASGANIQYDYGTLVYNGTIAATQPNTVISIAGSTNTSDAGLAFGTVAVPANFNYAPGTVQVNAGPNGTIALRSANDGTTTSLADSGAPITSAGGTLAILPASVDPTTFAFVASDSTPITLFGTGAAGLSIDAATYSLFTGFSTLALGSSTQTGLITVSGVCPTQGACTSLVKPTVNQSLTLMNMGSGSHGIQLLYGILLGSNTLTLASAGAVTDPGGIQAAGLLLAGPGTFTLNDPENNVGVLAMLDAGNVNFLNSTSFVIGPIVSRSFDAASNTATTIDATNSSLTGNLLAQAATGSVGLGGGTAAANGPTGGKNTNLSAGGTIDLVMENGVFINNGTGTLSAANYWRIWASTWVGETRGNVQPNTAQPNFYGCTFGAGCNWGGVVPLTGDHFVYVARPTVIVTANGATKIYGAPNPNFGYSTAGLVNGDTTSSLSGTLSTGATSGSLPGQYAINPAYLSSVGYIVQNVPGTLTVTLPYPLDLPLAVSAMQSFFGMSEKTFVYENNLQGTNICVGSNQPLFTTAPPGSDQDLLAVEWKRVRSQPNLNSCMLLNGQHGCGDF
ncbi:filamentous hemagglutinin N-terminal domain-containing protein [Paraburkholderia sp. A1RI-2L]|uniref:two-partner secretion domain-containing protein n=1 Tax=Paraburkholderia sp. A1RI-2L TaxID=3028367 RepID=UPI003B7C25F8